MNNLNITINFSLEDRIRIDALNTSLAILIAQLQDMSAANEAKSSNESQEDEVIYVPDTVAEQPQEAPQDVVEEQTPPAEEIVQDEPVECDEVAPVPTVTKPDILAKVIELCGKGKKAEAKDIITTYADSVSDLPDSALVEVWNKLTALEG